MLRCLQLICLVYVTIEYVSGDDWSYNNNGPSKWAESYPECSGEAQSPIDIETSKTEYMSGLAPIQFHGYDTNPLHLELTNNGHSLKINVNGSITISQGGLGGTYKLVQFHFHWGDSDDKGSEHTINGHQYAAELHFVHYDKALPDFSSAAVHEPDGLAVLGIFIKVGQYDNPGFNHFVKEISKVTQKGQKTMITPFHLDSLLPSDTMSFFRYNGSLTTPGCFQSVKWTLFDKPVTISEVQLNQFRSALEGSEGSAKIVNNFRPVQPLNGRQVYASQGKMTSTANGPKTCYICLMSIVLSILMLVFLNH